ncbi:putative WD40 repeat protein [Trypanosoma rangeli]|uniref:Putative WD40 repeat protein n=1 Tax=Trypanosoma rangeli TaxID=5698 RepID=A0A3R7RSD3_TRYRA|nr:putative WD40 repeat protein [Trypanosoma rangeli]RNF11925.1 putative WD40 repeat protein [Trypanosoma rangeli]|eukprot:RNF11925.1 putative WD40 repeat protein [Trypanosoma rangeli]
MLSGAQNIFLDRDGHGEERGPSTYVKRFGGGRPRDLNALTLESRPSSPSRAQSSEVMLRSRLGSRQCLPTTQFSGSGGISVSKHSFCRKDKRLLPLLHPKDEEAFFHSPLSVTPNIEHCRNVTADVEDSANFNPQETVEDDAVASQQGVWTQPLEERFSLDDLRRLMHFFSADSDAFGNNTLESVEGTTGLRRGDSIGTETTKDVLPLLNGSSGREAPVESAKQSLELEEQPAPCEEQSQEHHPKRSFQGLTHTRLPQRTEEELQRVLLSSDPVNCGLEHDAYTRVLSETEFAQAVKIIIPSATDAELWTFLGRLTMKRRGVQRGMTFQRFWCLEVVTALRLLMDLFQSYSQRLNQIIALLVRGT